MLNSSLICCKLSEISSNCLILSRLITLICSEWSLAGYWILNFAFFFSSRNSFLFSDLIFAAFSRPASVICLNLDTTGKLCPIKNSLESKLSKWSEWSFDLPIKLELPEAGVQIPVEGVFVFSLCSSSSVSMAYTPVSSFMSNWKFSPLPNNSACPGWPLTSWVSFSWLTSKDYWIAFIKSLSWKSLFYSFGNKS